METMIPRFALILFSLLLLALTEINSRFIRIQKLATVILSLALVSLALVSLWFFFMTVFATPDPSVEIGHVAPFMFTLALLLLAGIWYTEEFEIIRAEMRN